MTLLIISDELKNSYESYGKYKQILSLLVLKGLIEKLPVAEATAMDLTGDDFSTDLLM